MESGTPVKSVETKLNTFTVWLDITYKWILDQKLIGFHYRLCSNNGINSCGLNSNNQTTAASNKIWILEEEEGIITFIHTSWYVEAYSTGYQSTLNNI